MAKGSQCHPRPEKNGCQPYFVTLCVLFPFFVCHHHHNQLFSYNNHHVHQRNLHQDNNKVTKLTRQPCKTETHPWKGFIAKNEMNPLFTNFEPTFSFVTSAHFERNHTFSRREFSLFISDSKEEWRHQNPCKLITLSRQTFHSQNDTKFLLWKCSESSSVILWVFFFLFRFVNDKTNAKVVTLVKSCVVLCSSLFDFTSKTMMITML